MTFGIDDIKHFYIEREQSINNPPRLLVNTGCFVCRVDRPWCTSVHFTINDQTRLQMGNKLASIVEPEDWYFSRRVAEQGGKVMATRIVNVKHIGGRAWDNWKAWGNPVDAGAGHVTDGYIMAG